MLEFLKHVFQRQPVNDEPSVEIPARDNFAGVASVPAPAPPPPPPQSEPPPRPRFPNGGTGNGNTVEVSLQAVYYAFPPELKNRIKQFEVGEATVTVPLDKVLPQLALGAVKITFGELRRAAPQLFLPGNDCDQIQVKLPLHEILLQINPSLLARRQNQKHIEVPEEIRSPFGDHGRGLAFSVSYAKPGAPASARATTPAAPAPPPPAPSVPFPSAPAPSVRAAIPPAPAPTVPVQARPVVPPPAPPASSPPALPPTKQPARQPPVFQPAPLRGSIGSTPTPPPPAAKLPGLPPISAAPSALRGVGAVTPPLPPKEPVQPPAPGLPRGPALQPVKPAAEQVVLNVPLAKLAEGWPEALRHEIAQLNLGDSRVSLPADTVELALKRGKVAFPWKVLRSWIRPAPLPAVSVHDNTVLELPLKVIAPLFLSRHKDDGTGQHKVALDENIPNLFFGFPQPGTPSAAEPRASDTHAVTKPVDTNYYIWDDAADVAKLDETEFKRKPESSPGTSFVTRYATPNEVVSRAAALDGVAGALIALPDGLMVASRLSSDLNGDTLAAFLPQIFGKVSQCTKELRMGELNNLNFTVGNVPWKIFRVNAIFFAAFGRPGQPLPSGQLVALAAELDRKKQ
jgi:predicted regulator of Ras-like GTPase activity (Roadblock/LC7/MglB family)